MKKILIAFLVVVGLLVSSTAFAYENDSWAGVSGGIGMTYIGPINTLAYPQHGYVSSYNIGLSLALELGYAPVYVSAYTSFGAMVRGSFGVVLNDFGLYDSKSYYGMSSWMGISPMICVRTIVDKDVYVTAGFGGSLYDFIHTTYTVWSPSRPAYTWDMFQGQVLFSPAGIIEITMNRITTEFGFEGPQVYFGIGVNL